MCDFISDEYVVAGVICCQCKTYNGLQRVNCKVITCNNVLHKDQVPSSRVCEWTYMSGCVWSGWKPACKQEFGKWEQKGTYCPNCGGTVKAVGAKR